MKNFMRFLTIPVLFLMAFTLHAQEFGLASYYDDAFQGRKTAYGETYDKNKYTAAHKKHPKGTQLRVTRLDSKQTVVVTVNDKGPYIKGRVVDLSRVAAEKLGLIQDGIAEVKVEVVGESASSDRIATKPKTYDNTSTSRIETEDDDDEEEDEPQLASKSSRTTNTSSSSSSSKPKVTAKSGSSTSKKSSSTSASKARLVGKDYTQYGLYKIVLERPTSKGFGVQVASLTNYENVLRQVADLQAKWFENILISVERGSDAPVYKIILGPFDDESSADNYKKSLKKKHKIDGFTVSLDTIQY